jgi:plastocyanin
MRLVLAALAGFALAVVPALAGEHTVTAGGVSFSPKTIEIAQGHTVVWNTADHGSHNVVFDDESIGNLGVVGARHPSYRFDKPGTYTYYCQPHKSAGMTGSVVVKEAATTTHTTTTHTTTTPPTTTTTPTTTTPPPTQTTTTEPPPAAPTVTVRPVGSRFCARRSRRCKRPGVVLRVTSDTAHRVEGRLRREPSGHFGTVSFDVPKGTKTVRLTRTSAGRRLAPGRYSLELGSARSIRFRVRR